MQICHLPILSARRFFLKPDRRRCIEQYRRKARPSPPSYQICDGVTFVIIVFSNRVGFTNCNDIRWNLFILRGLKAITIGKLIWKCRDKKESPLCKFGGGEGLCPFCLYCLASVGGKSPSRQVFFFLLYEINSDMGPSSGSSRRTSKSLEIASMMVLCKKEYSQFVFPPLLALIYSWYNNTLNHGRNRIAETKEWQRCIAFKEILYSNIYILVTNWSHTEKL